MVICAAALVILAVIWQMQRKKLSAERKKGMAVVAVAACLGLLAGIGGIQGQEGLIGGDRFRRKPYGEGDYKKNMELSVEGLLKQHSYPLGIPEQKMTKQEEEACLEAAGREIEQEFPGENSSTDCIREAVRIRDCYQDGKVEAEWKFDNYDLVDVSGKVVAEEIAAEGELVQASVWLECGTSGCGMEFCFRIFPPALDEEQAFFLLLRKTLEKQGEKKGEVFFKLPRKVGAYEVTWKAEREYIPEKVLLLGSIVALLLPALERSREEEQRKKRRNLLLLEYPDVIGRLTLLLGAGMTAQRAFQKIAVAYEEKKNARTVGVCPAYEEMLVACREIESGVGEERAYIRFGERCDLAEYRKLGNILAQNLRKGGSMLISLLEKEAENAYEGRIGTAKKCGEEAAAKLLFPMILMLGVIMVILLLPAIAAFQL